MNLSGLALVEGGDIAAKAVNGDPVCMGCGTIFEANAVKVLSILVIGCLSLLGNTGVIAVLMTNRSLKPMLHSSNQTIFMLSLGVSDLGSAVCFLLFSARYAIVGHGPNSGTELDFGAGISYWLLTASLFNTLGIGLDKLAHIQAPYSYDRTWTRPRCACLVVAYWLVLACLSVLPTRVVPIPNYYYMFNRYTLTFVTRHEAPLSALLVVRYCMFAALLLTLGLGYGRLYCISRRFSKPPTNTLTVGGSTGRGGVGRSGRADGALVDEAGRQLERAAGGVGGTGGGGTTMLRGTKTIGLVLVSFLVVWLPYFIVHIASASQRRAHPDSGGNATSVSNAATPAVAAGQPAWRHRLDFCLVWCAMLHTCVNVLIYSVTYRPFRKGLVGLFCARRKMRRAASLKAPLKPKKRQSNVHLSKAGDPMGALAICLTHLDDDDDLHVARDGAGEALRPGLHCPTLDGINLITNAVLTNNNNSDNFSGNTDIKTNYNANANTNSGSGLTHGGYQL